MMSCIEVEVDLKPVEGSLKRDRFKLDNVVSFTQTPTELILVLANGVKVVVEDHMVECLCWKVAGQVDPVNEPVNDFLSHRFDKKD